MLFSYITLFTEKGCLYNVKSAPIIMIFLKIYCPNNVNTNGEWLNDWFGKNRNGVNVKIICTKAKIITGFLKTFKIKKTPINVSQMASKIMAILAGIKPKVRTSIVFFAKSSAGLKCAKNFKPPNHK